MVMVMVMGMGMVMVTVMGMVMGMVMVTVMVMVMGMVMGMGMGMVGESLTKLESSREEVFRRSQSYPLIPRRSITSSSRRDHPSSGNI